MLPSSLQQVLNRWQLPADEFLKQVETLQKPGSICCPQLFVQAWCAYQRTQMTNPQETVLEAVHRMGIIDPSTVINFTNALEMVAQRTSTTAMNLLKSKTYEIIITIIQHDFPTALQCTRHATPMVESNWADRSFTLCTFCTQNHLKCDGKRPCSSCTENNKPCSHINSIETKHPMLMIPKPVYPPLFHYHKQIHDYFTSLHLLSMLHPPPPPPLIDLTCPIIDLTQPIIDLTHEEPKLTRKRPRSLPLPFEQKHIRQRRSPDLSASAQEEEDKSVVEVPSNIITVKERNTIRQIACLLDHVDKQKPGGMYQTLFGSVGSANDDVMKKWFNQQNELFPLEPDLLTHEQLRMDDPQNASWKLNKKLTVIRHTNIKTYQDWKISHVAHVRGLTTVAPSTGEGLWYLAYFQLVRDQKICHLRVLCPLHIIEFWWNIHSQWAMHDPITIPSSPPLSLHRPIGFPLLPSYCSIRS